MSLLVGTWSLARRAMLRRMLVEAARIDPYKGDRNDKPFGSWLLLYGMAAGFKKSEGEGEQAYVARVFRITSYAPGDRVQPDV
jgi:hypothetical protein